MANNNLLIRNARLIYRNFEGVGTDFNSPGDRNFCVIIEDEEYAKQLIEDGWNVKLKVPKDDSRDPFYYIKVAVSYQYYAPAVYLVTKRQKTLLDEESVGILDTVDIINVDLAIRPSAWDVNGKTGVKAYLKTMYMTIEEDEFADKYDA